MPLSEVRKRSSLKLAQTLGHMTAGSPVFDFELAGTALHATGHPRMSVGRKIRHLN